MIEIPVLEGRRVRLEPLTLEHLPALERIAFDERIWRYMTMWVRTPAELRGWVEAALEAAAAGTALPWVTVLRESGAVVVGSTRLFDLSLAHGTAELGHTWLTPAVHGTGVNAEAKLLQLGYAFDTLGLRRVGAQDAPRESAVAGGDAQAGCGVRGHLPQPLRDAGWQPAAQPVVLDHTRGVAYGAIETRDEAGSSRRRGLKRPLELAAGGVDVAAAGAAGEGGNSGGEQGGVEELDGLRRWARGRAWRGRSSRRLD